MSEGYQKEVCEIEKNQVLCRFPDYITNVTDKIADDI